jgi:hypothetical protein
MFSYFFTDQLYLGLAEKVFWLGLGVRSQEEELEEEKNSLEFQKVIGF